MSGILSMTLRRLDRDSDCEFSEHWGKRLKAIRYYRREEAEDSMRFIRNTWLDDRMIQMYWDAGFEAGQQYGHGQSGGQVQDEYRPDYDIGSGGFG